MNCPICRKLMNSDFTTCLRCETPHHNDCWNYNNGCSIYACKTGFRRMDKEFDNTQFTAVLCAFITFLIGSVLISFLCILFYVGSFSSEYQRLLKTEQMNTFVLKEQTYIREYGSLRQIYVPSETKITVKKKLDKEYLVVCHLFYGEEVYCIMTKKQLRPYLRDGY